MASQKHCYGRRRRVFGWFCGVSAAILLAVAAAFIVVLIYNPKELEISVTDASLAQFALVPGAANATLSYSLAVAVTLRNPNRKGGVLFDRVRIAAVYRKKPFAAANLTSATPFYQGRRNTTVLRHVLTGRHVSLAIGDGDLERYGSETGLGAYVIDVKLAVRVKVRRSGVVTRYFEPPEIGCDNLRVPLRGESGGNASKFRVMKCKNVFIFKSRDVKHRGESERY